MGRPHLAQGVGQVVRAARCMRARARLVVLVFHSSRLRCRVIGAPSTYPQALRSPPYVRRKAGSCSWEGKGREGSIVTHALVTAFHPACVTALQSALFVAPSLESVACLGAFGVDLGAGALVLGPVDELVAAGDFGPEVACDELVGCFAPAVVGGEDFGGDESVGEVACGPGSGEGP